MIKLKPSSAKVQSFLAERGQEFIVQQMPASTRTAKDAAEAIGCRVEQIAKSLIFKDDESKSAVLIIASGSNQVSLEKVKEQTGMQLGKADADFVREKTGFAIGGVPPVAHTTEIITLLDQDLQQFNEIWAAAGTPNSVFKLTPEQLGDLTHGRWLDIKK
ncbi:YbaK/EbsC family protein [Pleionea litopenaei]|uniref:YbaK/EbsC family protein n=1 Tax=Pleionea litopenaei TaxID=3070815 RepID=A0AA51X6T5_9GAMM|nr:YbaK/EbsC family protein [Pleionea sp. HL-JVS1]WMS87622.1 YbaK/EbsC family protein [Pleionea sp. HL-JVS1]